MSSSTAELFSWLSATLSFCTCSCLTLLGAASPSSAQTTTTCYIAKLLLPFLSSPPPADDRLYDISLFSQSCSPNPTFLQSRGTKPLLLFWEHLQPTLLLADSSPFPANPAPPWQSPRHDVRVFFCSAHRMPQPAKSCVYVDNITSISSLFPNQQGGSRRGGGGGKGGSSCSGVGVGLWRPFFCHVRNWARRTAGICLGCPGGLGGCREQRLGQSWPCRGDFVLAFSSRSIFTVIKQLMARNRSSSRGFV